MNTISTDGTTIAWQTYGQQGAPAVVLMHSLGSSGAMWKPQIEALSKDFRLVVIDTRGHGASAAPEGAYRVEQLGRDVLAVAADAGIDRCHVVGLSLGGQMAMWLALNGGDLVRSLVLSNTAAKIGSTELWQSRIDAVRANGTASIRDGVLARWFTPDFSTEQPERFAEMQSVFDSTAAAGYLGCCAALRDSDLRAQVSSITQPTLVIGGAFDLATPPAEAEWLHANIVDSHLTVLPNAAHLSNLERPDEFNALLLAFLPT